DQDDDDIGDLPGPTEDGPLEFGLGPGPEEAGELGGARGHQQEDADADGEDAADDPGPGVAPGADLDLAGPHEGPDRGEPAPQQGQDEQGQGHPERKHEDDD